MKHFRTTTGVSVAVAAALALSACSSGITPVAETDTITIMSPFFSTAPPERDDHIELELERIAGTKLEIDWASNASYKDRTNVTLAGDDLPHVMVLQGKDPAIVKNAEAGAFWDLTDHLPRYPTSPLTEQVGSWMQLSTGVKGPEYYQPRWPTEYEQAMWDKRKALEASDLEHAVTDPTAAYVSETYATKGPQLDIIVTDARVQYVAGQIDEQGLQDAIALWRSSGGDQIIQEMNELARANG